MDADTLKDLANELERAAQQENEPECRQVMRKVAAALQDVQTGEEG